MPTHTKTMNQDDGNDRNETRNDSNGGAVVNALLAFLATQGRRYCHGQERQAQEQNNQRESIPFGPVESTAQLTEPIPPNQARENENVVLQMHPPPEFDALNEPNPTVSDSSNQNRDVHELVQHHHLQQPLLTLNPINPFLPPPIFSPTNQQYAVATLASQLQLGAALIAAGADASMNTTYQQLQQQALTQVVQALHLQTLALHQTQDRGTQEQLQDYSSLTSLISQAHKQQQVQEQAQRPELQVQTSNAQTSTANPATDLPLRQHATAAKSSPDTTASPSASSDQENLSENVTDSKLTPILPNLGLSEDDTRAAQQLDDEVRNMLDGTANYSSTARKALESRLGIPPARTVQCKRRGMPQDHTPETAYLTIPFNAYHGQFVSCSHPFCRSKGGPQFRYCATCKTPFAMHNFSTRHNHQATTTTELGSENMARATVLDRTELEDTDSEEDEQPKRKRAMNIDVRFQKKVSSLDDLSSDDRKMPMKDQTFGSTEVRLDNPKNQQSTQSESRAEERRANWLRLLDERPADSDPIEQMEVWLTKVMIISRPVD